MELEKDRGKFSRLSVQAKSLLLLVPIFVSYIIIVIIIATMPLSPSPVILKSLYRSLWRATKPFTPPASTAVSYACLLDRTGLEDPSWFDNIDMDTATSPREQITTTSDGNPQDAQGVVQGVFRQLLKQVIAATPTAAKDSLLQMRFPRHLQPDDDDQNSTATTGNMRQILRREFRNDDDKENATNLSAGLDPSLRMELAFLALRKLNAKLAWMEGLSSSSSEAESDAASSSLIETMPLVKQLPLQPASAYLRPGTFLIAHPNLTGYFRRTVLILLDHQDGRNNNINITNKNNNTDDHDDDNDTTKNKLSKRASPMGTYGLILNRLCETPMAPATGNTAETAEATATTTDESSVSSNLPRLFLLTFSQALQPLSSEVTKAFGRHWVRDGGPVHATVQMLHRAGTKDEVARQIGGRVIQYVSNEDKKTDETERSVSGSDPSSTDESTQRESDESSNKFESCDGDTATALAAPVIKYQGDLKNAAAVVNTQGFPAEDVTFFLGASSWAIGQLESEVERGFWLPCVAPPHLALEPIEQSLVAESSGAGEDNDGDGDDESSSCSRNEVIPGPLDVDAMVEAMDDFYIRMLASCGPHEAALTKLVRYDDDETNPHRKPSDDFS